MTIKVIGSGFGRTGTLSLKSALEILGFGPCYHMVEVFNNPGHSELWSEASDGPVDWDKLLGKYQSTVDWPSTFFWRELINHYSDAKIIHTERPTGAWVKSAHSTIFQLMDEDIPTDNPVMAAQRKMIRKLIVERTFGGDIKNPAHIGEVFEKHNQEVRRTVAADRLLIYESGQGWEPLCKFLGVPIPSVDYPKVNTTEDFQARVASRRAAAAQH